jgi:hypothetical protein
LKGHGFSRAVTIACSLRLYSLLNNSPSSLVLGGAAVHRCDTRHFGDGFSRRGNAIFKLSHYLMNA